MRERERERELIYFFLITHNYKINDLNKSGSMLLKYVCVLKKIYKYRVIILKIFVISFLLQTQVNFLYLKLHLYY
jgi:hypothetical protein